MRSFSCGGAFPSGWCAVVGRKLGGGCNKNIFGIFIPKLGGRFSPNLTVRIFFKWVGEKPQTRKSGEIFRDVT